MEIKTKQQYQDALKKRSNLLEAYSHLGCGNEDDLDRQISEINTQIERYESIYLSDECECENLGSQCDTCDSYE